jgi:hypothetical protein
VALDIANRVANALPWPDDGNAGAPPAALVPRINGLPRAKPSGSTDQRTDDPPAAPAAADVLLVSTDDPSTVLRPRLEAIGAPLHRIKLLNLGVNLGVHSSASEISNLKSEIRRSPIRAANPDTPPNHHFTNSPNLSLAPAANPEHQTSNIKHHPSNIAA